MGKSKDWKVYKQKSDLQREKEKKKRKENSDTNSAIPHVACFSVIVVYFRNKYRDNLAFYFKEKIYGS